MTQPDTEAPRAPHLRRNFSLTDRRRSSLLRGLHTRSSLKPLRGRVNRPASVCLEGGTDNIRLQRTLQNRGNRQNSMEVAGETGVSKSPYSSKPDLFQEKENSCLHSSYDRLTRRRGSAPSNLVLGESFRSSSSTNNSSVLSSSHPANILRHQTSLSSSTTRRGSLPSDLLTENVPKQLRNRILAGSSSGSSSKRPGLLRRRSMGTELMSLGTQVIKERQLFQKYLDENLVPKTRCL